ncbi:MAG: RNA polymerase sigma-54 factor [Alphaproteobacteria bacterium]|nr:RNA polymerase sigma-54 factor [Alphaproteobacteria bacterium]
MALGQRQELRQSQSLVMTPQLQQAIKLLQLTNLEIAEFVEQELERNPLLERQDPGQPERGDGATPQVDKDASTDGVDSAQLSNAGEIPADNDSPLDVNYGEIYEDAGPAEGYADPATGPAGGSTPAYGSGGREGGEDHNVLEQTVSEKIGLHDYLLEQLYADVTDPIDRLIGFSLVHAVDESGYLTTDLASVAEQLGVEVARVERALTILQAFDPPGIFARDLKECLAQQLRERDRYDPAMQALLDNLDLLAKRDEKQLMERCGVDAEDLSDMVHELRALDPKPGLAFSHEVAQTVVPDVFVRPGPGGGWLVEINTETLPRVLVNQQYCAVLNKNAKNKDDNIFITERLNSANWLVKSLERRAQTILRVATELVRQQDAFFARGVQHLRPLTLRDIAQAIEMHESTVSRVTANKYMATPRGTLPMKYFFTSAITSASGGESHSAESVRQRIKELIDAEAVDGVLSDDRIVEILRGENVEIARRTVAKYREALHIPSSVERRRDKNAAPWRSR